jgi:hypothetical protein
MRQASAKAARASVTAGQILTKPVRRLGGVEKTDKFVKFIKIADTIPQKYGQLAPKRLNIMNL